VLESVLRSSEALLLTFQDFSAQAMSLRDVRAKNIDGTSNDCTLCCSESPPFEVTADGLTWELVSQKDTVINGAVVELQGSAATKAQAVRYAFLDYVECVLQNDDGLPAGPFMRAVPEAIVDTASEAPVAPGAAISSPPMGFNSWNFYHCNIDENTVKAIVDAIATNGMKQVGFQYVNIDDCWQVERFPNGTIQPDPARFPSGMKAVADYAHSKGLKFGIYTARGSRTCQNRPGAYQHEEIDAATYCDWGLDYLKNDNCGGSNWPILNTSWIKFTEGFEKCYNRTGRYIVRSVEYCKSTTGCGEWIANSANLWRTTGDIQATWSSVISTIHANDKMASIARPGHFNDPDMMQVGNVGLSLVEQYSHMSLWCVAGAPLLIGTDLVHASQETLKILTNPEPISVNQDLGYKGAIQGRIVSTSVSPQSEVWSKRLADGESYGVVLLNLGDGPANVTARWSDLGELSGSAAVRDLWARKDLGIFQNSFTAEVQSHGTVFVKIAQQSAVLV
jgi:alpha-galactosidase